MTEISRYFSIRHPGEMFNQERRERKAETILAVLNDYFGKEGIRHLNILDIGTSTGIIANHLSGAVNQVTGIDVDKNAIMFARRQSYNSNVRFYICDATDLLFASSTYDVVICCNVYEHVDNPQRMINEIHRVLKKGGVCYFSAPNRLNINEQHYDLPFLSVIPKFLAHKYLKLFKNINRYDVNHLTCRELKKLVYEFQLIDYTKKLIFSPHKYHTSYMLVPGSIKHKIAKMVVEKMYWLCPSYIWLIRKK